MATTEDDVEAFLQHFKQKMASRIGGQTVIFWRNRKKNLQTQLELELKESDREKYLMELEVKNFYKGPVKDSINGLELWEFGKTIKNREIYIKISIGFLNKPVICISFHFAERQIKYPYYDF